ncbi:hypothetical protein [Ornithobacterium rhinotracheale]
MNSNDELLMIISTTCSYLIPFIKKIGEGTSRKIGEDIWNLIKKPFCEKGEDIHKLDDDKIKEYLSEILKDNPLIKSKVKELIESNSNYSQNINNNGNIDKQVNIGNITNGNFNF